MKVRFSAVLGLIVLLGYSCGTVATGLGFRLPFQRRDFETGINLYVNSYDFTDTLIPSAREVLGQLKSLGINHLSVVWPVYMDSISSTNIREGSGTPSKEDLRQLVSEAHGQGFEVTLRPTIDEGSFLHPDWRGTIRPTNIAGWFQNYSSLLYDYALLAEVAEVKRLSIGIELSSLENQTGHWENLVSDVRAVYSGEIIYSSNRGISETFDWQLVDVIGVDGFFESVVPDDASVGHHTSYLTENWANALIPHENMPVVITEAGVISRAGAFRKPWQWSSTAPVDQEAQRRYLTALCDAFSPEVEGIHWWKASLNPVNPGGFEILGLRHESVLSCFP